MFKLGNLEVKSKSFETVKDNRGCERRKYNIVVKNIYTDIEKSFEYTTQTLQYLPSKEEKILEYALYCIYTDYTIYLNCRNEYDFIEEFGYDYKEGKKIYKLLEEDSINFNQLVDEEMLDILGEYYENY